jgi:hypothetical protein
VHAVRSRVGCLPPYSLTLHPDDIRTNREDGTRDVAASQEDVLSIREVVHEASEFPPIRYAEYLQPNTRRLRLIRTEQQLQVEYACRTS